MAVSRKISQLNPLVSASLDTQVVGISAGSTVRMPLSAIKNVVESSINTGTNNRLNSLEQFTSSVSVTNIESLNTFTSSYLTDSASFNQRIVQATNEQSFNGLISGSAQITALGFISSSQTINTSSLVTSITNLTNATSSYETKGRGIISGSSQLTSSYDLRYAPSASYLTSLNGAISSSSQVVGILDSLNSYTSSLNNAIQLTGSTVSFLGDIVVWGTQSVINSTNFQISDNIIYLSPSASTDNDLGIVGHYDDGNFKHAGIFMDASDDHTWKVFKGLETEATGAYINTSGTGFTLADFKARVFTGTSFNGEINATNGVISGSTQISDYGFATTGSNIFNGYQQIHGGITASYYNGDGRYLSNLSPSTNWNYNQEYTVKKTEQLTFSGDYILEDTLLEIEGGIDNSIGVWEHRMSTHGGSIVKSTNNTYTIIGPIANGGYSDGNLLTKQFDTTTTLRVEYLWNGTDLGDDYPFYDIQSSYPYEVDTTSRLQNPGNTSESGVWNLTIPAGSWLTFGVWSNSSNGTAGTLQLTLPYLTNTDNVQYSSNKYFKKEGTIFIGGNLLVKDSYIVNNGKIYVGGEVILIGNSQIVGTGTII